MIPSDKFFVGGGAAETLATPFATALLALAVLLMFVLPRRHVVVPLLLGVFLVPSGAVFVVGGAHLMPVRVLALSGWMRIALLQGLRG